MEVAAAVEEVEVVVAVEEVVALTVHTQPRCPMDQWPSQRRDKNSCDPTAHSRAHSR
jgi:hypothetical protein